MTPNRTAPPVAMRLAERPATPPLLLEPVPVGDEAKWEERALERWELNAEEREEILLLGQLAASSAASAARSAEVQLVETHVVTTLWYCVLVQAHEVLVRSGHRAAASEEVRQPVMQVSSDGSAVEAGLVVVPELEF